MDIFTSVYPLLYRSRMENVPKDIFLTSVGLHMMFLCDSSELIIKLLKSINWIFMTEFIIPFSYMFMKILKSSYKP